MAENREVYISGPENISGRTVFCASVAGIAIGGPLLVMMGFSFLASVALLLVSSPLLLLFSPLLFGAALVLAAALAGFSAAAVMAVGGIFTLGRVLQEVRGSLEVGFGEGGVLERLAESGERWKRLGQDWAGHLQQKTLQNTRDNRRNRG